MVQLLYIANPLCSWCWGFAPSIEQLRARFPGLTIGLRMGPLAAEDGRPLDEAGRARLRAHWRKVEERTGQPFDFAFLERARFPYTSEAPCRALLLLRERWPALALAGLLRLQERFYARGEDITDPELLRDVLCGEFGVEEERFRARFFDPSLGRAVAAEWRATAALGVVGYPTLLALRGRRAVTLAAGWRAGQELVAALERVGARPG